MTASEKRGLVKLVIEEPGYRLIRARVEAAIEQTRLRLEQEMPPEAAARARGELAGLRLALAIPDYLLREGKPGGNKRPG